MTASEKSLWPMGQPRLKPSISMTAGIEEGPGPDLPSSHLRESGCYYPKFPSNYAVASRAKGPAPGILQETSCLLAGVSEAQEALA